MTVPSIDISGLFSTTLAERRSVATDIGEACERVGFLTVTGHGISTDLIDEAFRQTRLFELPAEAKMAAAWSAERLNRGYDPAGRQRLDEHAAADHKEAWSFGPEHLAGASGPMQAANAWPELDGFQDPIMTYHAAVMDLGERLLRAMALSLALPEDFFTPFHHSPVCTLRLLHYPNPPRYRPTTAGEHLRSRFEASMPG